MKIVLAAAVLALATPVFAQVGPAQPQAADHSAMVTAEGSGVVKSVDAKAGTVTIDHGPIPGLQWPAMTMAFKATPPSVLQGVSRGQSVTFKLMQMGDATTLTGIQRK